jgi:aspartyl protease family protein
MPGAVGLGIVLLAMAILVANQGEAPILGLTPDQFASVAGLSALALLIASLIVSEFRGRWINGLRALVSWAVIFLVVVVGYSYRAELQTAAARVAGELRPGETTVASGGEVVVTRRMDGTFLVNGKVNDRDTRFIFDTGATTVVLTGETAKALGIDPGPLGYTVMVSTANGRTLAAPVMLDRVTVGSIREQRVRALVAKPGMLHQNLLGMSFLDRLASYEVRQNRLIMRGRGA